MSEIREMVMAEPLFDTHEHQHGFTRLGWDQEKLDYRIFLGYAPADVATARGVQSGGQQPHAERFFDAWPHVRTTGYGQATEAACRELLGLDLTEANEQAIATGLRRFVEGKTTRQIYEAIFAKANVKWVMCDECWESPTSLEYFGGREHPEFFRHSLRYDGLIAVSSREAVRKFESVAGCAIHRLSDLDRAMDDYAEKARKAGKLGAFKCGLAYYGTLAFENSSYATAEPIFEAMMQGHPAVDLAPLKSYLFHQLVRRAADFALPLQVHTGYLAGNWGNPAQGDPMPLVPVFQRYRQVRFDLFHAGWPYNDAMCAIGKAFPNVYLDLCWAWSMNPTAMERVLGEWLAAVPNNKIFAFGGDTGTPHEMLGYAIQARKGVANVLERKVNEGEYDLPTAVAVAKRLMHENACQLFGFGC